MSQLGYVDSGNKFQSKRGALGLRRKKARVHAFREERGEKRPGQEYA